MKPYLEDGMSEERSESNEDGTNTLIERNHTVNSATQSDFSFDSLYTNIGKKVKALAKWMFIIEAIGAIITGIALLSIDEDLIIAGLLTLLCGPIVAWIGSWITYAFGELVEKTSANEQNTRDILKIMQKNNK